MKAFLPFATLLGIASLLLLIVYLFSIYNPTYKQVTQEESMQGMAIQDTSTGTGEVAEIGKTITVAYTIAGESDKETTLATSTYTFTLGAGESIPGFDAGIPGMRVGGIRTIHIPAAFTTSNKANPTIELREGSRLGEAYATNTNPDSNGGIFLKRATVSTMPPIPQGKPLLFTITLLNVL